MTGATCCSGIGAPETAMPWVDWRWRAEIEKFPAAVLASRHPGSVNLGDITAPDFIERALAFGPLDLLVAGTPCQAFSVAGGRRSLEDERGNLTLRFVEIINAINPGTVLWENVPGVLSTKDNAFGCFLAALVGADTALVPARGQRWTDAGMVVGPARSVAWRILDAQYFGLAQRRERVFVVACPRNGPHPAEILFEREGLRRHPPTRGEQRENASMETEISLRVCCVEGCAGKIRTRGMCNNHYTRLLTRGTVTPFKPINGGGCSITGCPNKAEKKTWCGTHYARWKKTGDVQAGKPITFSLPPEERFWAKVKKSEDACWTWTGAINEFGYGIYFDPEKGRTVRAHRYAFEERVGKIQEGLHLDHLCKNKPCVRPDHLEPVTLQENNRRYRAGDEPMVTGTLSARTSGGGGLGTDFDLGGGYELSKTLLAKSNLSHRDDAETYVLCEVTSSTGDIAHCLNTGGMGRIDYETETMIVGALLSGGTPNGHGTAGVNDQSVMAGHVVPVAFSCKDHGADAGEVSPTLRAMEFDGSHANGGGQVAVAFQESESGLREIGDKTGAQRAGGPGHDPVGTRVREGMAVRRLTPRECGRLQGFPDGYLEIEFRGRPAADGPMYKAFGNSMAVPVIRWIGERIRKAVEA